MLIPQELVDLIVDNLKGEVASLKSCSLTARTFVRRSQINLFRKIQILPPPTGDATSDTPCQRFHRIITSSPHLASLVEELRIVLVGSETSFEHDEDGEYLEERHLPWVISDRTLALVLPLLKLRQISIMEEAPWDWNGGGVFTMDWNTLGRSLKSALTDDLLSLFSETTTLKSLSLSRVYFKQPWQSREGWPVAQPWRPQLTSLVLSEIFGDIVTRFFLNPRIDLSQLTTFSLASDLPSTKAEMTATIMSQNRVLHLGVYCPERLEIKPNLRSLRIFTTDMYSTVWETFRACPMDSRLESIIFDGIMVAMFPSLDATIEAALARLPSLKRVEIRVTPDESKNFVAWSTNVRDVLPSLESRGLLRISEFEDNNCLDWE